MSYLHDPDFEIECNYCKIKYHNEKNKTCARSCNEENCWKDFCTRKCLNNHILEQIIELCNESILEEYEKGEQDYDVIQIKRLSENLSRWI